MRNGIVIVGAVAVAALLGFGAGRMTSPGPESAVAATTSAPTPRAFDERRRPLDPDERLAACERDLALATEVLDAQERARVGVPVPFPDDLPDPFRPDRFEAELRAALAECPDADVALALVDCDEFPCLAFFEQPDGGYNHSVESLRRCEGFSGRFGGGGGQANASFMTDAGRREWSMVSPSPPGSGMDENASTRWNLRRESAEAELMARWGGRPFSELEKLDQQIAFWHEHGGDAPGSAAILAELEARREELAAP